VVTKKNNKIRLKNGIKNEIKRWH